MTHYSHPSLIVHFKARDVQNWYYDLFSGTLMVVWVAGDSHTLPWEQALCLPAATPSPDVGKQGVDAMALQVECHQAGHPCIGLASLPSVGNAMYCVYATGTTFP